MSEAVRKLTLSELAAAGAAGRPIVMVTTYDAVSARLADEAGIDVLLVGDSAGTTVQGGASTVPVTMDEMVVYTRDTARGAKRALVIADMPFGSYQASDAVAVASAVRFVKAGADGVKLEGAGPALARVRAIRGAGIAVMGHLGLTPQSATVLGGYKAQARTAEAGRQIVRDARALQRAGCFSIVLEAVPAAVAARITSAVRIPTIGIGAGPDCSGQVLVWHDLLGLTTGPVPRFVNRYADLAGTIRAALETFAADVRDRRFPGTQHTYGMPDAERRAFERTIRRVGTRRPRR